MLMSLGLLYNARKRVVGNGDAGPARRTGRAGVLMGTVGRMMGAAGALGSRGLNGKPKAILTLM